MTIQQQIRTISGDAFKEIAALLRDSDMDVETAVSMMVGEGVFCIASTLASSDITSNGLEGAADFVRKHVLLTTRNLRAQQQEGVNDNG